MDAPASVVPPRDTGVSHPCHLRIVSASSPSHLCGRRIAFDKHDSYGLGSEEGEAEEVEGIVEMFNGKMTIECLDPRDPSANSRRDDHGIAIAAINTIIVAFFFIWGSVRRCRPPLGLLGPRACSGGGQLALAPQPPSY